MSHIDKERVPEHVAIIMDGNGRWAQARGFGRSAGHVEGVNTVRRITEIASEAGVKYLTLYTFSTENWNRPAEEVDMLMHLIVTAIERETPDLIRNNVRLTMIGDMDRLPEFAAERLQRCFADTAHCTGLNLILALSYSARWEITRAVRDIAREVSAGEPSARRHHRRYHLDASDYCRNPRPRPADTHRRRFPHKQFHAVAALLRRDNNHRPLLARLHQAGFHRLHSQISGAAAAFRTDSRAALTERMIKNFIANQIRNIHIAL